MFSKACEYGIRAVLYIAIKTKGGSRLGIKEIAREIDSPESFTAKILQKLVRNKIIASAKGPNGGFYLETKAEQLAVNAIVKAIDGDEVLHNCAMGLKECSDVYPCPIHADIKIYKARLREVMNKKTISDLAKELNAGHAYLKKPAGSPSRRKN